MRILFIDTTTDNELIGGGHLILPVLMGGLVKRDHEVHLVMAAKENEKLSGLLEESKAILHIAPWNIKAPVTDLVKPFNNWINSINPDVYVISSSAAIGWLVLPILAPNIPSFAIGHNNEETFYLPVRHYHRFLNRAVGVSEEICNVYRASCNMPAESVKWIPYGVPTAACVSPSENVLRLIYIGRLDQTQKRISDLITIALELDRRNINYILQVVGDGPEMQIVIEKLNPLIQKNKVVLSGWKSKSEVITALRSSDVFILTSAFEGFSIALTEAMANGCCPVVTDIKAGNKQLIRNGVNGYLLPVADTDAFVSHLSLLAGNAEKLWSLRQSAFETGIQYSIERMVISYEEDFKKAIEEAALKPRINDTAFPLLPTCISKYPMWIRRIKSHISAKNQL